MTLQNNLQQGRMNIWKAKEIMEEYMGNGRTVTNEVKKAYHLCSQFGMTSYRTMKIMVGEEIAQEIVKLDKILNI
jgi:hypothetical protein